MKRPKAGVSNSLIKKLVNVSSLLSSSSLLQSTLDHKLESTRSFSIALWTIDSGSSAFDRSQAFNSVCDFLMLASPLNFDRRGSSSALTVWWGGYENAELISKTVAGGNTDASSSRVSKKIGQPE